MCYIAKCCCLGLRIASVVIAHLQGFLSIGGIYAVSWILYRKDIFPDYFDIIFPIWIVILYYVSFIMSAILGFVYACQIWRLRPAILPSWIVHAVLQTIFFTFTTGFYIYCLSLKTTSDDPDYLKKVGYITLFNVGELGKQNSHVKYLI